MAGEEKPGIDVGRTDVGDSAEQFEIERYSHAMHIVSNRGDDGAELQLTGYDPAPGLTAPRAAR